MGEHLLPGMSPGCCPESVAMTLPDCTCDVLPPEHGASVAITAWHHCMLSSAFPVGGGHMDKEVRKWATLKARGSVSAHEEEGLYSVQV